MDGVPEMILISTYTCERGHRVVRNPGRLDARKQVYFCPICAYQGREPYNLLRFLRSRWVYRRKALRR